MQIETTRSDNMHDLVRKMFIRLALCSNPRLQRISGTINRMATLISDRCPANSFGPIRDWHYTTELLQSSQQDIMNLQILDENVHFTFTLEAHEYETSREHTLQLISEALSEIVTPFLNKLVTSDAGARVIGLNIRNLRDMNQQMRVDVTKLLLSQPGVLELCILGKANCLDFSG